MVFHDPPREAPYRSSSGGDRLIRTSVVTGVHRRATRAQSGETLAGRKVGALNFAAGPARFCLVSNNYRRLSPMAFYLIRVAEERLLEMIMPICSASAWLEKFTRTAMS